MAEAPLPENVVEEVLVRLPLAAVSRFSAVCKPWRSLLRGDAFLGRYRAFHRTPPVLGFFHNEEPQLLGRCRSLLPEPDNLPLFVPTAASCAPQPMPRDWYVIDSRHGRVLFFTALADDNDGASEFVVWDPIGGVQWEFFLPTFSDEFNGRHWDATVLCAVEGCNHHGCHGGPFLVAFVVTDREDITSACLYSSETGWWNEAAVASLDEEADECWPCTEMKPCVLVGGVLYFLCYFSKILMYNMGGQELALIQPPLAFQYDMDGQELVEIKSPYDFRRVAALMVAEGGVLGFAGMQGSSIRLWSREEGANGVGQWTPHRVIDLEAMLPVGVFLGLSVLYDWRSVINLIGLADGAGVLFISTNLGVFAIELRTGQIKRVSDNESISNAIPYTSFHIPDNGRLLHFAE